MIGVITKQDEHQVVEEFFQLFKTPWEYYESGRRYDVLLVTDQTMPDNDAELVILYGTERHELDELTGSESAKPENNGFVQWGNEQIPIYGEMLTFPGAKPPVLFAANPSHPVGYELYRGNQRVIRIGYDLFQEVKFLLTVGQPPQNALSPTLDHHISKLREWIVSSGLTLTEIPPSPAGYRFIACLTHDIDFIGIRKHVLDHSMLGFLYRATVGCLIDVARRKASWKKFLENLKAVLSLPLVYIGACHDPWDQFDRCLEIERDVRSTFFFIPYKKRPGQGFDTGAASRRATKYDVSDAGTLIQKLLDRGCEIGVHGIDAWYSVDHGKKELQRIVDVTARDKTGIRIHWLCRNENTLQRLDQAGYSYDSTLGYNETIGYKSGTALPYRPFDATALLEIPLHIQDTALFGRGRLNASEMVADKLCQRVIDHVCQHGGVLTVLWHQRSIGPERLWGDYYDKLVNRIRSQRAWFATAGEAAAWFRMRREVTYKRDSTGVVTVHAGPAFDAGNSLPGLSVRLLRSNQRFQARSASALKYDDFVLPAGQARRIAP